jgi:extradiol dioxygenase family protein
MAILMNYGAVVYAKDLGKASSFYGAVLGEHSTGDDTYRLFERAGFQLVVHQIPSHIAKEIQLEDPVERREESAIKLVFVVVSIDEVRRLAPAFGGVVDPIGNEWRFQSFKVCDGHDPEGNVIQLRERVA